MEENKNQVAPPEQEEEGVNIFALLREMWVGRKTIFITVGVFIALGLVAALTMKRTYRVSTVMVPQLSSRSNSSLSSLASLAGFDLGSTMSGPELSPLIYPQIVSSVPFQLELMHTPLHYMDCDTMISMYDYAVFVAKPTVMDYILRYTIGLPGVIMGAIRGPQPEIEMPAGSDTVVDDIPRPLLVNPIEQKMLESFSRVVSLDVDKKEGYITLIVNGSEPIQTAELAMKAQQLLQDEVTRLRVEKSEAELEYIQARYDEVKADADKYQVALAAARDRSQSVTTTKSTIERDRLQSKYNVSNAIYTEMAKQLEQAKMQVKKDTPVYTIIQPVTVPMKPSNSRAKTLIVWTFFGVVVGCGIVFVRMYWPKLKGKFKDSEEEETESSVELETQNA